jgi:hypothetical protein
MQTLDAKPQRRKENNNKENHQHSAFFAPGSSAHPLREALESRKTPSIGVLCGFAPLRLVFSRQFREYPA